MGARKHQFRFPGSRELLDADLPGTEFLLSAKAGYPMGRAIAKQKHFRMFIDAGRRAAVARTVPIGAWAPGSAGGGGEHPANDPPCRHAPSMERAVEAKEVLLLVLKSLSAQEKEAFRLIVGQGKSIKAAAKILGVPRQTLVSRWQKVRERTARLMGEQGRAA